VDLGWVGALCELVALGMLLATSRQRAPASSSVPA